MQVPLNLQIFIIEVKAMALQWLIEINPLIQKNKPNLNSIEIKVS